MKKLVTRIKPIGPDSIQLVSWIEGQYKATAVNHGEFTTMAALVSFISVRKAELGIAPELGEYKS